MTAKSTTASPKDISRLKRKVNAFLKSNYRTSWLKADGLEIFLRNTKRYINDKPVKTLDLANFTATPMGKGTFTAFLDWVETLDKIIYVENVLNKRLEPFLVRRGYRLAHDSWPHSYFLDKEYPYGKAD